MKTRTLVAVVDGHGGSSPVTLAAREAEPQSLDLILEIAAAEDRGDWPGAAQLRARLYAARTVARAVAVQGL